MKESMAVMAIILAATSYTNSLHGQENDQHPVVLKDSIDGKPDLSDFIIDTHGFVPVPFVVTEPAVGGFGGGLALVFLKKRPAFIDTVRGRPRKVLVPPDITGGGAMYTLNNSWATLGFRSGTWIKARSKYKVVGGYADVNLDFYRTNSEGEEKKFGVALKTTPVFASLQKKIKGTFLSAGVQYTLLSTKVKLLSGNLPDSIKEKELNSVVSMPGLLAEYDTRDNIFTPDRGMRIHASVGWSDEIFGSDYDYVNINAFIYAYLPLSSKVITGLRYEMQEVVNNPPFYLLPFLNLRGIPAARYQGNIFSVTEAEVRWDFVPRWSVIAFGGTGKVYDEWSEFQESDWISSGGAGFRYLVARKFKLRMGLDLARGPEQWAYYIVLGSAWFR